jgi:hypothetical protein
MTSHFEITTDNARYSGKSKILLEMKEKIRHDTPVLIAAQPKDAGSSTTHVLQARMAVNSA